MTLLFIELWNLRDIFTKIKATLIESIVQLHISVFYLEFYLLYPCVSSLTWCSQMFRGTISCELPSKLEENHLFGLFDLKRKLLNDYVVGCGFKTMMYPKKKLFNSHERPWNLSNFLSKVWYPKIRQMLNAESESVWVYCMEKTQVIWLFISKSSVKFFLRICSSF